MGDLLLNLELPIEKAGALCLSAIPTIIIKFYITAFIHFLESRHRGLLKNIHRK